VLCAAPTGETLGRARLERSKNEVAADSSRAAAPSGRTPPVGIDAGFRRPNSLGNETSRTADIPRGRTRLPHSARHPRFLGPAGTVRGCGSALPGLTVSGIAEAEKHAADKFPRCRRFAAADQPCRAWLSLASRTRKRAERGSAPPTGFPQCGRFVGTITALRAESTYLFYSHAPGFGLTVGL
jgi:hypothetical protein